MGFALSNLGRHSCLFIELNRPLILELASELESDLRDTVDWGKKWLVDFSAGKTQLVSFDRSNNNGSIDVKMYGSILEEKSSFKMLGLKIILHENMRQLQNSYTQNISGLLSLSL